MESIEKITMMGNTEKFLFVVGAGRATLWCNKQKLLIQSSKVLNSHIIQGRTRSYLHGHCLSVRGQVACLFVSGSLFFTKKWKQKITDVLTTWKFHQALLDPKKYLDYEPSAYERGWSVWFHSGEKSSNNDWNICNPLRYIFSPWCWTARIIQLLCQSL